MLAPEDRIARAEALQWMFFEQHSLEPNIGAAYFWLALIKGGRELQSHALEDWMENGYRALGVMETHLTRHRFFVADHFTIADIALYAYTHVADQADFRAQPVSGDSRLARARSRRARLYPYGLATGAYRSAVAPECQSFWIFATKTPRLVTGSAPIGSNRCRVGALYGQDWLSGRFPMRKRITSVGFVPPANRKLGTEQLTVAIAEFIASLSLAVSSCLSFPSAWRARTWSAA